MKKLLLLAVLLLSSGMFSQVYNPVNWSTKVVKISETEYELQAIASIESNWHLYSQSVPENGPIATSFVFESSGEYLNKGNTNEETGHVIDDPIFKMKIKYFMKKAVFKQRVKLKKKVPLTIKGVVEFMACDDSRCLPPKEIDLVFLLK